MSLQLAQLVLNGAPESREGARAKYDDSFVGRFMRAFGSEAAVYVGGPEQQEQPGLLVHGLDLPGATELAPGTRIFTGGVEAAVETVLSGEVRPTLKPDLGPPLVAQTQRGAAGRGRSTRAGRSARDEALTPPPTERVVAGTAARLPMVRGPAARPLNGRAWLGARRMRAAGGAQAVPRAAQAAVA